METESTQLTKLDEYIEGLTAARQFLGEHPELPPILAVYGDSVHLHLFEHNLPPGTDIRAEFAQHARTFMAGAPVGTVTKDATDSFMTIVRTFGAVSLHLQADRDVVCEAKVVGRETVEVVDPNAPTITVERDVIEWDCHPILADTKAVTV